jgi:hypothetical protein
MDVQRRRNGAMVTMSIHALRTLMQERAKPWNCKPVLSHANTVELYSRTEKRVESHGAIRIFYRIRWRMLGLPH